MTLIQLFTAIANAIRAKKGTSETIKAENFPTEISSIPTGGSYPPDWSEIGYEDTPESVIDGFNYAKDIYDNWDNSITSMANMYASDGHLMFFPLVDTSNVTNLYKTFIGSNLRYIPAVDFSKVTSAMLTFCNCKSLISVGLFDISNVLMAQQFFDGCTNLKDVPILNLSKISDIDRMFINCPNLSNESLNNILQMCIDSNVTNTSYKTLSRVGLSSSQATTCQSLSNWSAFVSAGWASGY